jgi:hypothetical protein
MKRRRHLMFNISFSKVLFYMAFFSVFLFFLGAPSSAFADVPCNGTGESCGSACDTGYTNIGFCATGSGPFGAKLICCKKGAPSTTPTIAPDPASGGSTSPASTPTTTAPAATSPATAAGSSCKDLKGECRVIVTESGSTCNDDEDYKGPMGCGFQKGCCVPKSAPTPTPTPPATSAPAAQVNPAVGTGYADIINNGLVPCGTSKYPAPCTLCHVIIGFHRIFTFLLGLLITATLLAIVGAGVFYMVSTGNKGMMDTAKQALTYALTAFALGLGSWLIVTMILTAFGFNNAGNWWNFSCDATQSQGASSVANNVSASGTGAGSYKASGYLSPKAQEVINNYMNTQVGKNYGGDVHCYSTTDAAYTLSGLQDLGGRWKVWDGTETINPGDAMQTKEHTWLVLENGATSNAIPGGKIGVNPDGLNYNLNKAKNLGLQVKIIHVN